MEGPATIALFCTTFTLAQNKPKDSNMTQLKCGHISNADISYGYIYCNNYTESPTSIVKSSHYVKYIVPVGAHPELYPGWGRGCGYLS